MDSLLNLAATARCDASDLKAIWISPDKLVQGKQLYRIMLQVAASAVETTGSKAVLKAAFGILMTADSPKVEPFAARLMFVQL